MGQWWVQNIYESLGIVAVVAWVVAVIGSIVLHELAHGWAAIWQGDRTPIELDHMTWNPLVHMGQTSLLLFAFFGIAYGMMPVNPYNFRSRFGDAIVAIAGPVMNLLIAAVFILLGGVASAFAPSLGDPLGPNLALFCFIVVYLNITLAMFNLIPVPPLDGSRILGDFVPSYARLFESENGKWVGFGLFLLVFFFAGRFLFAPGQFVAEEGIAAVASLLRPS